MPHQNKNLLFPIIYLENHDLNSDGKLSDQVKKIANGRPLFIMIQGSYCNHCHNVKPFFQSLANNSSKILHATILVDGSESEQNLATKLEQILPKDKYNGVPTFVFLNKKGKYKIYEGPRTEKAFKDFCINQ